VLTHVIGEQTEFGPDAPVNNYRVKGQGSLFDIDEWTKLKEVENLYEALQYAISRGEQEARDNLRVYGTGFMTAVKIE